ncbi:unnamed protein product [Rotaria magnacalcarata]|uniref:WSC domain-containing protein n=2 Tax=Rotaria magnacalcarata TaxID=392030 RepID=A0A816C2I8_9BILA|nr:unnamed protein product [Rotaria magnacalcarata]
MEPILCFRLCETPIIYIQGATCRCSGSGLMDYNRQRDKYCSVECPKPGDPRVKTAHTCGGSGVYSVYADDQFYTRHAHLLDYRIKYESCQFWNRSDYYDTFSVKIDASSVKFSLNRLESCAALCLDQNTTTLSIAFNNDSNQCLCIIPKTLNEKLDRALYLTILPDNSCDRYCDNIVANSKAEHGFKCGSLTDQRIFAIYTFTDLCPIDSVYVKEWKNVYLSRMDSYHHAFQQTQPSTSMIVIVTIDPSWKCSSELANKGKTSHASNASYFTLRRNYLLENGCLRENKYSFDLFNSQKHLCMADPINKKSLLNDFPIYYHAALKTDRMINRCHPHWLDLNENCYRISDKSKTIQEAKSSCINISEAEEKEHLREMNSTDRHVNEDEKQLQSAFNKFLRNYIKGEIVQYTLQWQTGLGFYLLDTKASNIESAVEIPRPYDNDDSFTSFTMNFKPPVVTNFNLSITVSSVNEFQMMNLNQTNNSTIKDDSCIVVTRSVTDRKESSILKTAQINNCTNSRHVLCKLSTLVAVPYHQGCFDKPLTLGLPAIISNYLTHELCSSTCRRLETNLAVVHINKCYCLNSFRISLLDFILTSHEKYKKNTCGNPCPGMFQYLILLFFA